MLIEKSFTDSQNLIMDSRKETGLMWCRGLLYLVYSSLQNSPNKNTEINYDKKLAIRLFPALENFFLLVCLLWVGFILWKLVNWPLVALRGKFLRDRFLTYQVFSRYANWRDIHCVAKYMY